MLQKNIFGRGTSKKAKAMFGGICLTARSSHDEGSRNIIFGHACLIFDLFWFCKILSQSTIFRKSSFGRLMLLPLAEISFPLKGPYTTLQGAIITQGILHVSLNLLIIFIQYISTKNNPFTMDSKGQGLLQFKMHYGGRMRQLLF